MRPPDFVIGLRDNPYMLRWWIIPRNQWFNIYLHKIIRDDDDRALHDHPWISVSVVLKGVVREVLNKGTRIFRSKSIIFRSSRMAHRLEVVKGPCWTLFFTGPTVREWGFHCPKGWVSWKQFVDPNNPGTIGPGCGELS